MFLEGNVPAAHLFAILRTGLKKPDSYSGTARAPLVRVWWASSCPPALLSLQCVSTQRAMNACVCVSWFVDTTRNVRLVRLAPLAFFVSELKRNAGYFRAKPCTWENEGRKGNCRKVEL